MNMEDETHFLNLNLTVLTLLFLNIQGISGKCNFIESLIADSDCDFLCLSEHWLSINEVGSCHVQGYSIMTAFHRQTQVHGGVLIYASDKYLCNVLDISCMCTERDFEACAIELREQRLIIVAVYRTPDGNVKVFLDSLERLLQHLLSFCDYRIIIGGDVNSQFDVTRGTNSVKTLLNTLRQYNMYYHNDKFTRGDACLDNVFSNLGEDSVMSWVTHCPFSDHDSLWMRVLTENIIKPKMQPTAIAKRVMSKVNVGTFKYLLSKVDWITKLHYTNNDDPVVCFNSFFDIFMYLFEQSCPIKQIKQRNKALGVNKNNKWYNRDLVNLKNQVSLAYDLFKAKGTDDTKRCYVGLKVRYKAAINRAKLEFNARNIELSGNKCSAAWSIIRNVGHSPLHNSGSISITPDDFNGFFVESVKQIRDKIPKVNRSAKDFLLQYTVRSDTCFVWRNVTPDDVLLVIKKMKNSKSRDYYDLSNSLLKELGECVCEPLAICINLCLGKGYFPNSLKIAKVNPIFKKGEKSNPASFRPISLVPILGKIIEHVVFKQVSEYLEYFGFFPVLSLDSDEVAQPWVPLMLWWLTSLALSKMANMLGELFVT